MSSVVLSILFIVSAPLLVSGYSNGPPEGACGFLSPSPTAHQAEPSTDPVPYVLDLSALERSVNGTSILGYVPGQQYTLTLQVNDTAGVDFFRGFLIQTRSIIDDSAVATFTTINEDSQLNTCSPTDSAINHVNNADKVSVDVQWNAPAEGTGEIQFGWTAVQIQTVYWANIRSEVVYELDGATALTAAGTLPMFNKGINLKYTMFILEIGSKGLRVKFPDSVH